MIIKVRYKKSFFLSLILGLFIYFGNIKKGYCQDNPKSTEKVSITLSNTNLGKALTQIASKVKTNMIYLSNQVSGIKIDYFEAIDEPLHSVLDRLVKGTKMEVTYSLEKKGFIISLKKSGKASEIRDGIADSNTNSPLPSVNIKEIQVSARRILNTETSLLWERKNSLIVSDGISAKNIDKTASITTTQALERVSGVTITDDKYVAIRGLGDRSVIAELNGSRLSSSDPDRSSVPLDLVPAALLDNITVYKSITPDKPADAPAGIIELKTKSIPEKRTLTLTAQLGINTNIGLGGTYQSWLNENQGFFGQNIQKKDLSSDFLNLGNQYIGQKGLQAIQQLFFYSRNSPAQSKEAYRISNILHQIDPIITTRYASAQPNQIYGITYGDSFKLFGKHEVGFVLSSNYYQRTEDITNGQLTNWTLLNGVITGNPKIRNPLILPPYITPNNLNLSKYLSYSNNTGTQTINYGWLAALSYRPNNRNELSFQYLESKGGEVLASHLSGQYEATGFQSNIKVFDQVYSLKQSARTFTNFNLQGEHKLFNKPLSPRFSWGASRSISKKDEPDFRFIEIADLNTRLNNGLNVTQTETDYYTLVNGQIHLTPTKVINESPNGRKFRTLKEENYNLRGDLLIPFTFLKKNIEFKTGFNILNRTRVFQENVLSLPGSDLSDTNSNNFLNSELIHGDPALLIGYNNIALPPITEFNGESSPPIGAFLYTVSKSPNNYKGANGNTAVYAMANVKITDKIQLVGGMRLENTHISTLIDTVNVPQYAVSNPFTQFPFNPNSSLTVPLKPFYSANLIIRLHKNMNIRLGYFTSLSRPELREITPIAEFDPFQFAYVIGNPNLVNQFTRSVDFRWEYFTSTGEIVSVSAFGKYISNQLNKIYSYNSSGTFANTTEFPVVKFINESNRGQVYGLEIEFRKNLGKFISTLNNFNFSTNILLAYSEIRKNQDRILATQTNDRLSSITSPLFEQAPYSINSSLDYSNPKTNTSATLNFNIVGERLVQVQLNGTPDLYDRPVPLLDFVFSQRFAKQFTIKGFFKNILNSVSQRVYAEPRHNGEYRGKTYTQQRSVTGSEISIGLTYDLF